MSSMQLHGDFGVGFKRFKSQEYGNDCMMFYPCSKTLPTTKIAAYDDLKSYVAGSKLTGQGAAGVGSFVHRLVSGMVPDA